MASNMADLIAMLTANEQILSELSLALTDEQQCIVDLDLIRLTENSARKEELTTRLLAVRSECCRLIQQAGGELGLERTESLTPLIAATDGADRSRLRPLQQRLITLARALDRQHRLNRSMLDNSLLMIKNSMSLFARLLGGCDTYGAQGFINSSTANGSILRQEI